jgi:class 3 adenylate cyclase
MQPIRDLQRATDEVRGGDFDAAVPVTTGDEIGELAASFNDMVGGLRERERIRHAFGTYLDEEVAEHILSDGFNEGGELVEVSIIFCDVKDFTSFAAGAEASEVVGCLNALFEVVVPIIAEECGHVDKFEGDGLMAVFGAPHFFPDHADRALRAAMEIDRRVNGLGEGGPFEVGVGINTGEVVAGSVGGAGRLNFSVIGDAVNVASRVQAETRKTGDDVLLTEATRAQLTGAYPLRRRGERTLRGIDRPVALHTLQGEPENFPSPVGAVRAVYARVRGDRGDD